MSRSLRRGAVATAIVLALTPLAAGCSAGFNAETGKVKPDNISVQLGQLNIQNVSVVTGASGAALTAAIFNNGTQEDKLTQVSVAGAGDGSGVPITIPPNGAVYISGVGGPKVTFGGGEGALKPGNFVNITMTFASSGQKQFQVPVLPGTGINSGVAPGGPPAPAGSPSGTASPGASPAPGESAPATPGTSPAPATH